MKVWEKSLISFLIMPHRIPLRNALHPSPSLTDAVVASHDCHSISSHSLCTPPSGCLWPAWSSFAFWCPGHCSTGNVIAVFLQDMSMSLSSQTVALYWSAYTVPHLRFGLDRKLSVSFSYISCDKHPVSSCLQQLYFPYLCPIQ